MSALQEFKCPCCNGSISFDTKLQKMKCPYCDTEFSRNNSFFFARKTNVKSNK